MKRVATLTALLMLFCGLEAQLIQHLDHDHEERYNIAKGNEDIILKFKELKLAHEKSLEN